MLRLLFIFWNGKLSLKKKERKKKEKKRMNDRQVTDHPIFFFMKGQTIFFLGLTLCFCHPWAATNDKMRHPKAPAPGNSATLLPNKANSPPPSTRRNLFQDVADCKENNMFEELFLEQKMMINFAWSCHGKCFGGFGEVAHLTLSPKACSISPKLL